MDLSGVGVWSSQLRYGDAGEAAEAAAELEEFGYLRTVDPRCRRTRARFGGSAARVHHEQAVVATGILNLWMHEPADVAASYASLTAKHGERFLLGIGVSHAPLIDSKEPGRYRKPLAATRAYLDAIDATEAPVPVANRVLAALGPKMLELVRHAGPRRAPVSGHARPHARYAREHARRRAHCCCPSRRFCSPTTARTGPGHRNRLAPRISGAAQLRQQPAALRLHAGRSASVSDRLFDALIAWGDEDAVVRRVNEHLAAGADHVCVQALTADPQEFPRDQWRRLAAALV